MPRLRFSLSLVPGVLGAHGDGHGCTAILSWRRTSSVRDCRGWGSSGSHQKRIGGMKGFKKLPSPFHCGKAVPTSYSCVRYRSWLIAKKSLRSMRIPMLGDVSFLWQHSLCCLCELIFQLLTHSQCPEITAQVVRELLLVTVHCSAFSA